MEHRHEKCKLPWRLTNSYSAVGIVLHVDFVGRQDTQSHDSIMRSIEALSGTLLQQTSRAIIEAYLALAQSILHPSLIDQFHMNHHKSRGCEIFMENSNSRFNLLTGVHLYLDGASIPVTTRSYTTEVVLGPVTALIKNTLGLKESCWSIWRDTTTRTLSGTRDV